MAWTGLITEPLRQMLGPELAALGSARRLWNEPSLMNFYTGQPTRYNALENMRFQENPNQIRGIPEVQANVLQEMNNGSLFGNMWRGYQNLLNEGANTVTEIPGRIGSSIVQGMTNLAGYPQMDQNQPGLGMLGQLGQNQNNQGFDPSMLRYRALENLASGLENNQGPSQNLSQIGRFGGSFFGPAASAIGGQIMGQAGNAFGRPYQQNFLRDFSQLGQPGQQRFGPSPYQPPTQPYWMQRNRNINLNMNPMARGY